MELLTLTEARALTEGLRRRLSALYKLKEAREREWYAEHPEVTGRLERIGQLQDELGEDGLAGDLSAYAEQLRNEMELFIAELAPLPKCPDGLTAEEAGELRNVMSRFQKLRRRLPKAFS